MNEEINEYLWTYGIAFMLIIVVWGSFLLLSLNENNEYNTETKAFSNEKYSCDLYIERFGDSITNITLIDCIRRD